MKERAVKRSTVEPRGVKCSVIEVKKNGVE